MVCASLVAVSLISGCAKKDTTPIQLGFVAGLTGRTADLGTGGRNGAQLAIEQTNATGGISGRQVNLLIKDDETNGDVGQRVVKELIDAKVSAIIGPMISSVAAAVIPQATEAGMLMMGGSISSDNFSGKDDQFFRVIASSSHHASALAKYLLNTRHATRATVLVEQGNKAYTESWLNSFSPAYVAAGGTMLRVVRYTSNKDFDFSGPAKELSTDKPQIIILCASAVDSALVVNQLRQLQTSAQIVTTEWAGTGKLTELGGKSVEGLLVPQYLKRNSTAPAWLAFRKAYRERFQDDPGFPALVGFNATQIVLRALTERKDNESLKQTILRLREFSGLQETLRFDDFGDVTNITTLSQIKDGQYVEPD
jgi:branched-chain amino acid transport system substrate-binding protein